MPVQGKDFDSIHSGTQSLDKYNNKMQRFPHLLSGTGGFIVSWAASVTVFALYTIVWHSAIHIELQPEAKRQRFEILLLLLWCSKTDKATLCVNKIRPFGTICKGRNTLFYIMLHKHTSKCLQESLPNLHICLQTTTILEINFTREVSEAHLRFMQINTVVWELFWHIPYISVGLYIHIHACLQFCEQIVKNVTGKNM